MGAVGPGRLRRIGPRRMVGADIRDLYEYNKDQGWEQNYWRRVDETLHHMMGGTRFLLPDAFLPGVDGREHMIVIFPQKTVLALRIAALLANRKPKAMRYAVGQGLRADTISTDVETWLNAVLEQEIDGRPVLGYPELVGRLALEGAIVVKALSTNAHWRKRPSWLDTLDEEEWANLSDRRKRRYRLEDEVVEDGFLDDEEEHDDVVFGPERRSERPRRYMRIDKDGVPVPRSSYHRDAAGRTRDHGYYTPDKNGKPKKRKDGQPRKWQEDRNASRRAFQQDQKEWLAQRLPFEVEVISARHCIPIMDDQERIEAIVVCRTYNAQDLLEKDFIWGDGLSALSPNPEDGEVTVWELWHQDERDRPYAAYFVDGYEETMIRRKTRDGIELADAVIDLQKEYGCKRLPIAWFWGLHFPVDDITKKGVPLLWPVLSSINAAEGLATATHIYAWRNAFAGSFITIPPEMLDRYAELFLKDSEIFKFGLGPMENAVVPGVPQVAAVPAPGAGVQQLLQMLLQASAAMSPSDAVFGGGGAASGHDRALSKEYLEVALSQVLEGARSAVQFISELILDYAVWIAERTGKPVPVYANTPNAQIPTGAGKSPKPATDIIELLPSWLKTNTRVHCYFETDDADELMRSQLAQQHMQGLVPWDEYREKAWNDPNPEITLIKIFGDQALRTPEGRQEVLEFARELRSDEMDQEREQLIKDGLLSPDGVPMVARVPFTPRRKGQPDERPSLDPRAILGAGGMPGAPEGIGGLPPGVEPPPGVPDELLGRHLQLDRSHAAARALAAPSGPLGAIGGPANGQSLPMPGAGPGGPQGPVNLPRQPNLPPGTEGATDIDPYPKQFGDAPTMPGMGSVGKLGNNAIIDALGGVIGGQLRKAAKKYHERRRGPRIQSGR